MEHVYGLSCLSLCFVNPQNCIEIFYFPNYLKTFYIYCISIKYFIVKRDKNFHANVEGQTDTDDAITILQGRMKVKFWNKFTTKHKHNFPELPSP
jgi:hypothetical protein